MNVFPSGEREMQLTSPSCPTKEVVCCPVSMSHSAHVVSPASNNVISSIISPSYSLKHLHDCNPARFWTGYQQFNTYLSDRPGVRLQPGPGPGSNFLAGAGGTDYGRSRGFLVKIWSPVRLAEAMKLS